MKREADDWKGSEKQHSCFWFGFCVSYCASLAQKRTQCCRCVSSVPSALGLMCVPAEATITVTQSDRSLLFLFLKHRQKTHPLQSLEIRTSKLDLKCACFVWLPASAMWTDLKSTSCMRSLPLRKHPSHRRSGPATHRKLLECMSVRSGCFRILGQNTDYCSSLSVV